jgi:hypothetical protein
MASIMICQTRTDIGSRLINSRLRRGKATGVITVDYPTDFALPAALISTFTPQTAFNTFGKGVPIRPGATTVTPGLQ